MVDISDVPHTAQAVVLISSIYHTCYDTGYCVVNVTLFYPPVISGSHDIHEHDTSVDIVMRSVLCIDINFYIKLKQYLLNCHGSISVIIR